MKTSADIRHAFLEYFAAHDHAVISSSALVPHNDPSLLFTNAGMVQFKDVFLGQEPRPAARAVSAQKCLRAGGKHNDLENVGFTARHHTFFEMLGNFSFGDYFKEEAIAFCWEFLTDTLGLDAERLWVSVYDEDADAYRIWTQQIGIAPDRVLRLGAADNFWSMGETGPCGPCSEVYYDHGPDVAGGLPGTAEEGDRYTEIWNLVFMQYQRDADGTLRDLPQPSVDTGMGLERISAVLQGVTDNYETDLFTPLLEPLRARAQTLEESSCRVIADHVRAGAFLIVDGVLPANEGRGYVLRRILRRALRHAHRQGMEGPLLGSLLPPLIATLGDAYPELRTQQEAIATAFTDEEERFTRTLRSGMEVLEEGLATLAGKVIPGDLAFTLYDTFGFPLDLTRDVARERGLTVNEEDYRVRMEEQRAQARAAMKFSVDYTQLADIKQDGDFSGYTQLEQEAEVVQLYRAGSAVTELTAADTADEEMAVAVLATTPFYAESGGQVGDTGWIRTPHAAFEVLDTQKHGQAHLHIGRVREGTLAVGTTAAAQVDMRRRQSVVLNHSATHLLHAALRNVLGAHVTQKGSLVAPDRLRFDFSHPQPVSDEELHAIEAMVCEVIRTNAAVDASEMAYDDALDAGALAFFGDKYGDTVRVLQMGDFSMELCGGTHVSRTGDIGMFVIVSEGGVSTGVRRIEAVTGANAHAAIYQQQKALAGAAALLQTQPAELPLKLERLLAQKKELEKTVAKMQSAQAGSAGSDLAAQAEAINGVAVLAARHDANAKTLREVADKLRAKLGSALVVLGAVADGKVVLLAATTKDLAQTLPAGELMSELAATVGGRGGGRAEMAQGGGDKPEALDAALASVADWVRSRTA